MKKALAAATEFFNPVDPKELVRKWQATLRQEQRALDRQVREIKVEENKVKKSIKEAAKRGDLVTAKTLAKEVIHSRHAVSRLVTNKAQLMSIGNALTTQMAMVRVTATLSKSTEVMQAVTAAMRMPEMQKTMMEMSREMMKAGLIDEMMSDAVDGALDDAELDEETEEQVAAVLDEIAKETAAALPAARRNAAQPQQEAGEEEEEDDMAQLQARLQAVKS
ncbi:Snf7-domain-containing protein [Haematococcus lacustris]